MVGIHNMDMFGKKDEKSIAILAPAKINLTLEVLGKRKDGYHELRSIMHSIALHDRLIIKMNDADEIRITCSERLPELNTAYLAAERFKQHTGCGGVDIHIDKRIPSEAGLGGASADAAGVLRAMESLFGEIDDETLYSIGRSVGADVPFCLLGGCAIAEGIGERLTALPSKRLNLLLVKGKKGISTGALFNALNADSYVEQKYMPNYSEMLIKAMAKDNQRALPLYNDLMKAAISFAPEIEVYRARMLECGASASMMTGSGSVVYGIFESAEHAEKAYECFNDCEYRCVTNTISESYAISNVD